MDRQGLNAKPRKTANKSGIDKNDIQKETEIERKIDIDQVRQIKRD